MICAIGGVSFVAFKGALLALRDMRRYDRIREMSGEGPLARQVPQIVGEIVAKERGIPAEVIRVMAELPRDLARYLALSAM